MALCCYWAVFIKCYEWINYELRLLITDMRCMPYKELFCLRPSRVISSYTTSKWTTLWLLDNLQQSILQCFLIIISMIALLMKRNLNETEKIHDWYGDWLWKHLIEIYEMNLLILSQISMTPPLILGKDKWFHPTLYWSCNYLSMLGLKINLVSKRGSRWSTIHDHNALNTPPYLWHFNVWSGATFGEIPSSISKKASWLKNT